ncbi:unnamed protein product [Sphenostylis stenocarpa]|uniref:Uncharacterized protein n=1 Tax=Sphenostylis stenocarpa TaxID=92480 RepID=A0AA86RNI2_9FABA|nr:unnamed protein product [Sphenostylis stenocarpa]
MENKDRRTVVKTAGTGYRGVITRKLKIILKYIASDFDLPRPFLSKEKGYIYCIHQRLVKLMGLPDE